jgi:DNA-binding transcriptional LysR family regulator
MAAPFPRDRVETRELEYFVAVAEELHFGRAAERLGIAQPPLSRAIRRLERRLGVTLLDRNSHGAALTGPGEVLLREARRALEAVNSAVRLTQRAGNARPRIVLVMKPGGDGGLLPAILAAYGARPGAIPVEVLMSGIGERARALRDGSADVALLHAPYEDLTGFDTEELMTETQVVVVPEGHRLAGREHATARTGRPKRHISCRWSRWAVPSSWRRSRYATTCAAIWPASRSWTPRPSRWCSPGRSGADPRPSPRSSGRRPRWPARRPVWSHNPANDGRGHRRSAKRYVL